MKVSQKGLAIVGVPLIFQTVFVLVLLCLFSRVKDDLIQENKARDAVEKANVVMQAMMDANTAAFCCACSGDLSFERVFDREMKRVHALTEQMRALSEKSQYKLIDAIAKDSSDLEMVYRTYLHNPVLVTEALSGREQLSDNSLPDLSRRASTDMGVQFATYIANAESVAEAKLRSLQKSRKTVYATLFAGLLADVFLTISISAFISRGIIRRLGVICLNIDLLRLRQDLNPLLSGHDEIAEIDAALHRTAADLREAEQSKAEALRVIQEQLHNPLKETLGVLAGIKNGAADLSAKACARLDLAVQNVERLLRLINDLVHSGSSGKFALRPTRLSAVNLLRSGATLCQSLAERHKITIDVVEPSTEMGFTGDADLLSQVLTNLISNAIKFSPEGAVVTISACRVNDSVEFAVVDKGRGVPETDKQKIFELFQQVSESDATSKGGTGLGLPICKSIIAQHDGSIGVDSVFGAGSRFWFRLPLQSSLSNAAESSDLLPEPPLSTKTSALTARHFQSPPAPLKLPFKRSLSFQLIGLVFGPLVLTTVMVCFLASALYRVEQHIEAQINAKQITALVNRITISSVNLLRTTMSEMTAKNVDYGSGMFVAQQKAQFSQLNRLVSNRTDLIPLVRSMEEGITKTRVATQKAISPDRRLNTLSQSAVVHLSAAKDFQQSASFTRQVGRKLMRLASASDVESQKAIFELYKWITYGAPFALLIGAGVTIFSSVHFSRHIAGRLERLRSRAAKLGKENLDWLPDSGQDEVAAVDHFFRDAARRMAELDQFKNYMVGVVSHELKTPLQTIFGVVSLLPKLAASSLHADQVAGACAIAEFHVRRVIKLVHDLLTVEKMHSGTFLLNLQTTSLSSVCQNTLSLVLDPRSKEPRIYLQDFEDATISIDGERVAGVLATIVSNVVDRGGSASLSATFSGNEAVFIVESDLKASAADERVFEQFPDLSSDKFSKITTSIIKAHDGTMEIDGDPAVFSVTVKG